MRLKNSFIQIVITFLLVFYYEAIANPLLNANVDEKVIYDNLEASQKSKTEPFTIKPLNYYKIIPYLDNLERVKLNLNLAESTTRYIKPLNSFTTKLYITNENQTYLEGQSGLKLKKGVNLYIFQDGLISLGKKAVFYYQFREWINKKYTKIEPLRLYFKYLFYKWSFEAGIDNVDLGPGEYGMLLSRNAKPFPMVKLQTEAPLNFIGKWDVVLLRGWLNEDRRDVDDPNILALRIAWKPTDWIEIGGTKTTMYGGKGRPGYSLVEYWDLITSSKDNVSYSKYDNDSFAEWDVSFYIPLQKWFKNIKVAKFYYLEGGSDVTAFWQDEEKGEFRLPFGFQFHDWFYQAGVFWSTDKSIFRLEYASTSDKVFVHHIYNYNGYTYKGLSLGYPYSRNIQSIFFKHRYYLKDDLSFEYKIGAYKQPGRDRDTIKYPLKMTRYYASLLVDKRVKNLIIEGFIRFDKTNNYDTNPLPTQFNIVAKDKSFYIIGSSISWRW